MKIKFIKQVKFCDCNGVVLRVFEIGDEIAASAKSESYFITAMGGIYFDEAVEV